MVLWTPAVQSVKWLLTLIFSSPDNSSPVNNIRAWSICLDVRKAFDTVLHHLLLSKVENFGFDLGFLHLFSSYFLNRYQSVRINNFVSFSLPVTSGVPEGSGPEGTGPARIRFIHQSHCRWYFKQSLLFVCWWSQIFHFCIWVLCSERYRFSTTVVFSQLAGIPSFQLQSPKFR